MAMDSTLMVVAPWKAWVFRGTREVGWIVLSCFGELAFMFSSKCGAFAGWLYQVWGVGRCFHRNYIHVN